MRPRPHHHEHAADCGANGATGFGDFLRSLLSGIPWSDRAEAQETLHFQAPRSGAIRVENVNGKTRILGEDRDDIEVRLLKVARAETEAAARALADSTGLAVNETDSALEFEVSMPRKWNRRGVVHMELRVPRGTRVDVHSSNGKVCVSALAASVKAHSSNGAVSVENVDGDVEVYSSNAKVHCAHVHGRLVARTSNGKIEVTEHRGALDGATSNGLIDAEIAELGGPVVLATSNGRIAVTLPEQADADVDVRVDNGIIRSQRSLCRCTHSTGGRLAGQLGKGGVPIKLRTSNGSISVR
jgi:DUF4097 and DUF4098 domain-containing protein YvlB